MADKKITQLTDLGDGLAAVDLFHVVDDPTGTPINKKIAAQDVFNNMPTYLGIAQASQSLTGDGSTTLVSDVTSAITEIDATSAIATVTLANGSDGQVKTFLNVSTGGTYAVTITPASLRGYTNIILNAPGETVTCIFKNSNWNIIAGNGYTTS
jgi:predicted RNA-binding protein with TRAM domain